MPSSNKKSKLQIGFTLGPRESLGAILCSIIFFILPVVVIEYSRQQDPAYTETYTEEAITSAQGEGHVAGATTSSIDEKYFTIPLINFKFDKTLSESSSIFFLFGTMLFVGGSALGISTLVTSGKKMVIPKR